MIKNYELSVFSICARALAFRAISCGDGRVGGDLPSSMTVKSTVTKDFVYMNIDTSIILFVYHVLVVYYFITVYSLAIPQ